MLGVLAEPALVVGSQDISNFEGSCRDYIAQTGIQLIDKAIQSSNMTSQQSDALKQLRTEGELLTKNGHLRGVVV
jgi:hypothetical protein